MEVSALPSLTSPPCCLPSDCPLYHTSGPEHSSHPAVLISPSAVPHVLDKLMKWVASNLANPFPCCLSGTTTDSCPWFSSVKPSEAPATKASYVNMKTDSLGELHTYVQNRYCQGNNKKYKQQNPICWPAADYYLMDEDIFP